MSTIARLIAYSFVYSINLILQMYEMKALRPIPFEIAFADCMDGIVEMLAVAIAADAVDNDCFDSEVHSDCLQAFETLDPSLNSLNHLRSPMTANYSLRHGMPTTKSQTNLIDQSKQDRGGVFSHFAASVCR